VFNAVIDVCYCVNGSVVDHAKIV